VERYWWNLFEAVGNRDLHAMAALSESLLTQTGEPPERREFLLAVALLIQRAGENSKGTRDPWK